MASLFTFPNPVNEKAARVVAACVLSMSVLALVTGWYWLLVVLALGFLARVATGPKLSPLGQLATRVVAPRLGAPKQVAGPPKRFAQSIGLVVTGTAAVCALALGLTGTADALLVVMIAAAGLEAVAGVCVGCHVFALLMRVGAIPEGVCESCRAWAPGTGA